MKNKIPFYYRLFLWESWIKMLFFDLLCFYDFKKNRKDSKGIYKIMVKSAEQHGVKPYDWSKFKYFARLIAFSMFVSIFFSTICRIIDINIYWNMIPTFICNVLFIENYNRIMRFLNSGNVYFWSIMIFTACLAIIFLIEIFVKFYLQIS